MESEWIKHDGGECPIPWAKAGEFQVSFFDEGKRDHLDASQIHWPSVNVIAYRLTDGWIPVIGWKCPQAVGWRPGTWELKRQDGVVKIGEFKPDDSNWGPYVVALRLIKQPSDQLLRDALKYSVHIINTGKLASKPTDDEIFDTLMFSYEAKRKAIQAKRERKVVVPPIGASAMMVLAGKAMRDE